MNDTALYNCDVSIWRDLEPVGSEVRLADGMLCRVEVSSRDWVARFRDDEHARKVLTEAGFKMVGMDMNAEVWVKQQ
jgi:hypothetical protein